MAERVLVGVAASPGTAYGKVRRIDQDGAEDRSVLDESDRPEAAARASTALDDAARELESLAGRLRADGRSEEADILDAGMMMAEDPVLRAAIETAILGRGLGAPSAIRREVEAAAAQLDAVDDADLAARAADVRSLGRRAARLASAAATSAPRASAGSATSPSPARAGAATSATLASAGAPGSGSGDADAILVAADLGPADVAELDGAVRAIALAAGGTTAHAAIVARGLGLPMVVGLGADLLGVDEEALCIVDGTRGLVVTSPDQARVEAVLGELDSVRAARRRAMSAHALPTVTRDGRTVRVLANASGAAEVRAGLLAGAEGVGLLRTELAFLEAAHWPSTEEHRRVLEPALAQLAGRTATVRILDFGGDKTPPFLQGTHARGVDLLLGEPDALSAQLQAILDAGAETQLRLLIPMVTEPGQVRGVRASLEEVAVRTGHRLPLVAAMVEVPGAVAMADRIAAEVGLFSIGTNDLTSLQLGLDRTRPGGAPAHHPAVLRLIADTVAAARRAHIPVEVCGESASDPMVMPLLVGLGVDELSVGAAMVASVRSWVRALDHEEASRIALRALDAESAAEVQSLTRPLRRLLDDAGQ
jgi:phosphoenolpyruvate-protein kinase (PTS system EI component)